MNHGILSCVRWVRIRDSCELWDKGNVPPHATYVSSSISKGLFTSWTTKLSHVIWPFTMVTFSWSIFLKEYKKFKGCGHFSWTWIKRCDHAPKSGYTIFFLLHVQKGKFWGFSRVLPSPLLPPFFPLVYNNIWRKKKEKKKKKGTIIYWNNISFSWSLDFCNERTSYASPTANHVGHDSGWCRTENKPFPDLKLHGHFDIFFPWLRAKWSQDEFNSQSHI